MILLLSVPSHLPGLNSSCVLRKSSVCVNLEGAQGGRMVAVVLIFNNSAFDEMLLKGDFLLIEDFLLV